ncbi:GBS Bsp-like repeat-containing protein [Streptococcus sp. zg-JUN1979]|uniref:GBS Bsp-like repeat-containing protein n=1 Tax=Streptococcus sp. zg-JUN1979 TaxID=3391450 RepID=UPI0039A693E4
MSQYSRVERLHTSKVVKKQRFSIRKLSKIGAVSALVGTSLFFAGGVKADETALNHVTETVVQTQASSDETSLSKAYTSASTESLDASQVQAASSEIASESLDATEASQSVTITAAASSESTTSQTETSQSDVSALVTSEEVSTQDTSASEAIEMQEESTSQQTQETRESAARGQESSSNPAVGVLNYDRNKTTFDVAIVGTDSSKAIKGARIAVWSEENDQDDLRWYTPAASNNQIRQTVNIMNHAGKTGDYVVHVYTDFVDGSVYAVSLGSYHIEVDPKSIVGSASQGHYNIINRVVYLDAGHGGYDPGASYFGQHEKNLTLQVQQRLKAKLEASGYQVVTSRTTDKAVELLDRSQNANQSQADIFVSLHFNASTSAAANGLETYYYVYDANYNPRLNKTYHNDAERLKRSSDLAQAIQTNVQATTGFKNNGVKRETFAVVRETVAPAVLVELGYISNAAEFSKINTAAYQERLAQGLFQGIQSYYDKYQKSSIVKPAQVAKEAPSIKVVNYNKTSTMFDVVVTGSDKTKTVKQARIAVWSDQKGQDDLRWYTVGAKDNQLSQKVNILNHAANTDNYNVHVYVDFTDGSHSGTNLGKYYIEVAEPEKPSVAVVNYDKSKPTFDVVVTGSDKTKVIKGARIAIWSEEKGQDDIKWYVSSASNNKLSQSVDIRNHANKTGDYNVHVYTDFTDGTSYGVVAGKLHIEVAEPEKPSVAIVNYDKSKPTFDVVVTGSDKTKVIKGARIAVWSEEKGQDDIKWYVPSATNNKLSQSVDIRNHANKTGDYNVHVYTDFTDGTSYGVVAGKLHIEVAEPEKPSVAVVNYDKSKPTFDVVVTGSDKTKVIKGARIAVWSEKKGQDDIKWYVPSANNNKITQTIDILNHAGNTDTYNVHVYTDFTDGTSYGVNAGKYAIEVVNALSVSYKGTGNYEVKAHGVPKTGDILMAVWSDKNGQDDIRWYQANKQDDIAISRVNVTNHKDTGDYHVHVYHRTADKLNFLFEDSFAVDKADFKAPYYRQRDPKWASQVYGLANMDQTGCVPTSLAMVFSALDDKAVLPTDVASYLYQKTDQFNKKWTGTGVRGLLQAVDGFGYKATALPSLSAVTTALQEGHYLVAAIQNNIFVRNGSHELVLKGYENGKTYVSDPYTPMLSGWYSVSQLWSEQSRYQEDRAGVPSTFIKITDA